MQHAGCDQEAQWATLIRSGRVWNTSGSDRIGSGRIGWAARSHGEGPTGQGSHGHSGGTRRCDLHPACGGVVAVPLCRYGHSSCVQVGGPAGGPADGTGS